MDGFGPTPRILGKYATLFVSDHFDEGYGPLTGMAAAAAATTTLHVASAVFPPTFDTPPSWRASSRPLKSIHGGA